MQNRSESTQAIQKDYLGYTAILSNQKETMELNTAYLTFPPDNVTGPSVIEYKNLLSIPNVET